MTISFPDMVVHCNRVRTYGIVRGTVVTADQTKNDPTKQSIIQNVAYDLSDSRNRSVSSLGHTSLAISAYIVVSVQATMHDAPLLTLVGLETVDTGIPAHQGKETER